MFDLGADNMTLAAGLSKFGEPGMARLLLSVRALVKMISFRFALNTRAMRSRAEWTTVWRGPNSC